MDEELVWLSSARPDARRLEAIDVMIELTEGKPQEFRVSREAPRLLRFAYGGDGLRPFTAASLDAAPSELLERGRVSELSSCPTAVLLRPPARSVRQGGQGEMPPAGGGAPALSGGVLRPRYRPHPA